MPPRQMQRLVRWRPTAGRKTGTQLVLSIENVKNELSPFFFRRFPEVGNFLSYSRLVRCEHESAGKKKGSGGKKIGNAHLKWAFSEAACLMLRAVPAAKKWLAKQ